MWRTRAVVSAVLFAVLAGCSPSNSSYLLVDQAEIDAARAKAERHQWARAALDDLLARAEKALSEPVRLPDRGGQWPHWYSCTRDGARLQTVSETEHRCPVCGDVYSGDPYDAVILYSVHRRYSNAIRDLGLAYRFTGRKEFAERAGEILMAYADRYSNYPLHDRNGQPKTGGGRVMAQTLDESVWLIPVVFGYALVRDTLDAEQKRHIEEDLLVPAAEVIRSHRMRIHNIQCWKNSAVGLVGIATNHPELVEEAIENPERGFRVQIEQGVTHDGLWWEGSLGYHQYTMNALWPLAEAARLSGIDLYSERYRSLYNAPIDLALPNGDAPGFNDSAGANLSAYGSLYEIAYARWQMPAHGRVVSSASRQTLEALLYGAEELPEGHPVPTASTLLMDAGYAVLRSSSLTAVMRYGQHGGGHGHPDKLNVVTFGAGRLGGLDPGSINYGVPLHREWYKSTIAHNTVAVDEANQTAKDGELENWDAKAGSVTARASEAYPGVELIRSLTLQDGSLRDRFECRSEKAHTYDWAFHVPGKPRIDKSLGKASGVLGKTNGYQHLRLKRRGKTSESFTCTWDLDGATLELQVKGAPGTEIFLGEGPGRKPETPASALIIRRRTKETAFEVIHKFHGREE